MMDRDDHHKNLALTLVAKNDHHKPPEPCEPLNPAMIVHGIQHQALHNTLRINGDRLGIAPLVNNGKSRSPASLQQTLLKTCRGVSMGMGLTWQAHVRFQEHALH